MNTNIAATSRPVIRAFHGVQQAWDADGRVDPRVLRGVLGAYTTGVTVITTLDPDGQPCGVTANSFSSVSLDPPLVLWSQALAARSHPAFARNDRFVVNILADNQVDLSTRFATAGADKFSGVACHGGIGGLPVLENCAAVLECIKVATYPGGDHAVFLGQIENFWRSTQPGLAFGNGQYLSTQARTARAGSGHASA